ncbi:MAG: hypothetical protein MUC92_07055 [Fimbriimonadaceae bacterium]|jgi:hypothetical protein|nr:hypothetical protein [Fimbriimonadaceae bacterium]
MIAREGKQLEFQEYLAIDSKLQGKSYLNSTVRWHSFPLDDIVLTDS